MKVLWGHFCCYRFLFFLQRCNEQKLFAFSLPHNNYLWERTLFHPKAIRRSARRLETWWCWSQPLWSQVQMEPWSHLGPFRALVWVGRLMASWAGCVLSAAGNLGAASISLSVPAARMSQSRCLNMRNPSFLLPFPDMCTLPWKKWGCWQMFHIWY